MSFSRANKAKADFYDVYSQPTPHAYIAEMSRFGYQIGEEAKPYLVSAVNLLKKNTKNKLPLQMLDVGCSYGIASALIKYGCSYSELVAFYATRAPIDYPSACKTTRSWLNVVPSSFNMQCVGLDCSESAIQFGIDSGLLDAGITKNFESTNASPTVKDQQLLRNCNLLISTGAIGYITERTLDVVLQDLGQNHPSSVGPFAIMTILRMFDTTQIKAVFEKHGFKFAAIPDVRLPQRRFVDNEEQEKVVKLLNGRGINTSEWEDQGIQYANLFVAAPTEHFEELYKKITACGQNAITPCHYNPAVCAHQSNDD